MKMNASRASVNGSIQNQNITSKNGPKVKPVVDSASGRGSISVNKPRNPSIQGTPRAVNKATDMAALGINSTRAPVRSESRLLPARNVSTSMDHHQFTNRPVTSLMNSNYGQRPLTNVDRSSTSMRNRSSLLQDQSLFSSRPVSIPHRKPSFANDGARLPANQLFNSNSRLPPNNTQQQLRSSTSLGRSSIPITNRAPQNGQFSGTPTRNISGSFYSHGQLNSAQASAQITNRFRSNIPSVSPKNQISTPRKGSLLVDSRSGASNSIQINSNSSFSINRDSMPEPSTLLNSSRSSSKVSKNLSKISSIQNVTPENSSSFVSSNQPSALLNDSKNGLLGSVSGEKLSRSREIVSQLQTLISPAKFRSFNETSSSKQTSLDTKTEKIIEKLQATTLISRLKDGDTQQNSNPINPDLSSENPIDINQIATLLSELNLLLH
ncbi:hypothetical protein AYI68_g4156 [Smittium mucronatum]|uniref:Uncharacterized protein n=1 Tax=Smittium mucronatum TaxID=133383 RepID=A0A1R0GXV2_9FUNG|nr:hypothetical protein AYI68_g4156 [Smittium mucronatum]